MRITSHETRVKLIYFLETYLSVSDCYAHNRRAYDEMSMQEQSDQQGWFFDWEAVVRHVSPHLLVVMSSNRRDSQRAPTYVVIPGEGDWIEMSHDNAVRLVEELTPDATRDVEIGTLLNSLRPAITMLPQERVGEAMKHLNALTRIAKASL